MSRDHHFFFAKNMLPTHWANSTDMLVKELTGPQREAFIFYLWNEAGGEDPLPHVDIQNNASVNLTVVGHIQDGGKEIIVIQMPPAIEPNEAMFVALVRDEEGPMVYYYERCMGEHGTGVAPDECVLSGVRGLVSSPGGMQRSNFGFFTGANLAGFKQHLSSVLGVSLDGLETSLPEITMDAFIEAGGGPGPSAPSRASSQGSAGVGQFLEWALLARAVAPVFFWVVGYVMFIEMLYALLPTLYGLLTFGIYIMLLVWMFQRLESHKSSGSMSGGIAVVVSIIPVVNLIGLPLALKSTWKAVKGSGGNLALLWGVLWFFENIFVMISSGLGLVIYSEAGADGAYAMTRFGSGFDLPGIIGTVVAPLYTWGGLLLGVVTYLMLWHIVRTVNTK